MGGLGLWAYGLGPRDSGFRAQQHPVFVSRTRQVELCILVFFSLVCLVQGSQELDSLRHLQVHGAWRDSVPPIDLESKKQSTINDLMVDRWLVSSSKIAERPSTAGWPSTPPCTLETKKTNV